jgi:group I intron endonuclease
MGCLYQIESPSGKKYIGITSRSLKERWRVHRAHANRSVEGYLQNALRKYGPKSFIVKELVIANNYEYLKDLEVKAIKSFNTKAPHGYNMTDGGDGVFGVVITEEGRSRRRAAQKKSFQDPARRQRHKDAQRCPELREFRSVKAKNADAKTRNLISEAQKELWKSPEYKKKMSARPKKTRINDGLNRWQRHRLSDLEAYRAKKREYAKTPAERERRRIYMRAYNKRKKEERKS